MRFPRQALKTAAVGLVSAGLVAWAFDEAVGFQKPFDRIVRETGVVPAAAICLLIALAVSPEGRRWLVARVPVVSASALGLFRIAFAIGLAFIVRTIEPSQQPLCYGLLALFGAGLAARVTFALFVLVFTRGHLGHTDDHAVALPLKTLWLMTVVPWGAGLSVDALIRRRFGASPAPARSRAYGLGAWIPILMLGLAYAAAAFAKMDDVGLRWITGGAVKYFFLVDGHKAPVHWGRYIVRSDTLSMLASGLAVAAESSVVLSALWPTPAVVAVAGLITLVLHLGFYLFQGVWWSPWWALLPAFLPWEPIASRLHLSPAGGRPVDSRTGGPFAWAVGALLLVAVLQQPVASLLRVTYGFALSDFPMYSNVYFSSREEVAAFQEATFQPPPIIRFESAGDEGHAAANLAAADRGAVLSDAAQKVARREPMTDADTSRVREALRQYVATFGATPSRIDVLADTWKFDWSVADFVPRREWKAIATVNLDDGVIEVRKP